MAYIIERPYGADDNNINKAQVEILEGWALKHNEVIEKVEILKCAIRAETKAGRKIIVTLTDGCMSKYKNVRQYMQMWEDVNGKRIRIKKSEW